MEKKTGQKERVRENYCFSQTSDGELNEEPDSVIRSKPARSVLPADRGGPGPQGAGQFVGPGDVPGPRGGCCAPRRSIFQGFRRAAEPTVATGPLIFSGV